MIPLDTPQFIETVDVIVRKIKHCLITNFGKTLETCSNTEFYRAFCLAFREEIMINWVANTQTIQRRKPRVLYYLCMEYMPGRFLTNNLLNLHAQDLIKEVLKRLNKNFSDVLSLEDMQNILVVPYSYLNDIVLYFHPFYKIDYDIYPLSLFSYKLSI